MSAQRDGDLITLCFLLSGEQLSWENGTAAFCKLRWFQAFPAQGSIWQFSAHPATSNAHVMRLTASSLPQQKTNLEPQLLVMVIRALEDSKSNLHLTGRGRAHVTLHGHHPVTKLTLLQSLTGSVFRVRNKGESSFGQEK